MATEQHGTCRSQQGQARFAGNDVGAQDEHAASHRLTVDPDPRQSGARQRLQRRLQVLHIGRRALIQDHDVDVQLLQAPVFERTQHLPHDPEVVGIVDAHQHDRQVARNAMGPKCLLAAVATTQHVRRWPQGGIVVEQVAGQALEVACFVRRDTQVMQFHLALRPGERRGTIERRRVTVLVHQVQHLLSRRGDQRPERDPCRGPRGESHAAREAEDRVEHRSDRSGREWIARQCRGGARLPAASDEGGAIRLEAPGPDGVALDDGEMRSPGARFMWRAPAACRQQRADRRQVLGLHEELGEGRMRLVGGARRQHEFRIRRDFDRAHAIAHVRQGDAANLGVALGRHDHVERRRQVAVATHELGPVLAERHFVGVGFDTRWLIPCGPDLAGIDVAQEEVRARRVAGDVGCPARDRQVVPLAVARAGGRQHHGVVPVRQHSRAWRRVVRRIDRARQHRHDVVDPLRDTAGRDVCQPGPRRRAASAPAAAVRSP